MQTLRPGFLVSLKSTVSGNVKYFQKTLESEHITDSGAQRASWETERLIDDPAEHEAAKVARAKARACVTGVCSATAFGLLCPENKSDQLAGAIADANRIAEAFNATAQLSRLSVFCLTGRIASDDVEAVRAISSEVRDLLGGMEQGIRNLDAETVRSAAKRAKSLSAMLQPQAAQRLQETIDAVRATAKRIVKAGEGVAMEIDQEALRSIAQARGAFLDLDQTGEVLAPAADAVAVEFEAPAEQLDCAPVATPEIEF